MADQDAMVGMKWIREDLGYPDATRVNAMSTPIKKWWGYYTADADFYTVDEEDANGKPVKYRIRSITPGNMVCEDMADLLLNETSAIGVDVSDDGGASKEWVDSWNTSTRLLDTAPIHIQRLCATGTGVWANRIEGLNDDLTESPNLRVLPQFYDARSFVPLSYDEFGCYEIACFSSAMRMGRRLTQVQVHRVADDGTYELVTGIFDDLGDKVEVPGISSDPIPTGSTCPTFGIGRLALDNVYWDYSPFGVSLLDQSIGAIETVDLAFDNIGQDIFLGKKLVFIDGRLLEKDPAGNPIPPQRAGKQFIVALTDGGAYDDSVGIHDYNPQLRSDEDRTMLNTALQALGKRIGFGDKYYALDDSGGITTAKEVASDNSEMMRVVKKHEKFIRPAIETVCASAAAITTKYGTAPLPDLSGAVHLVMGDSIIQDDDSLRERDRADVAIGALPLWVYIMRWQGVDEATAREWAGATEGAQDASAIPEE